MAGLKVRWIDYRGKVWHLTEGTEGVVLDLGQRGLGWAELTHTFTHNGMQHAAASVGRGVHMLKVLVGASLTGQAFYDLAAEWWYAANSPYNLGTLEVERPDGTVRTRRLRLAETPDTSYMYDPGIGLENGPELWALTGNGPWWHGPEQSSTYTLEDITGGSSTPFYGDDGTAWPFYISGGAQADDAWISNQGQGPMWPTWTLAGPLTSARFGVPGGGELGYAGSVAPGELVVVTTDPSNRYVTEQVSGDNRYGFVSGVFAPVPAGDRVPLTVIAEGMTAQSSITVTVRETYAGAF